MSTITLESLLKECDLDESDLNSEIERKHFLEISRSLSKWRLLALKLPEFREVVVVIEANKHDEEDRRLEFLEKLKQKRSFKATYGLLVRSLLEIERVDDAQSLCLHLKNLAGSKSDQEVTSAIQFEKLKKEDEKLEKKFENAVEMVQASFTKNEVKTDKVLSSLKFIKSHEEKRKVKCQFRDLLQDQSLENLFFTFSDIWNYMHPGLLEFIVDRFGTTSDQNIVQEYKKDLQEYRRSVKLGEFVKICKKINPLLYNKELSMVVGDDWRCKTLQDLEDARLQFADKTKCDELLLRALPKQSQFTIVFSMPSWIQLNLVEMYPVLSTIGATKVYLNDDYIYECVPLKKEADDYRKREKLQSFQSEISKERISHFPYISDSDFENLIEKVSASLGEKDAKAILALRCGYSIRYDPRDVLLQMFRDGEIIKCAPSNFQSLVKKIERMDVIPIIDDFYKNYTKPETIAEDSIDHVFDSLNIFSKSIQHSLWDLEVDYKIASLTSVSSELENIFYQAYIMYETIQNAILEFSDIESIKEEIMKLKKLGSEVTGETKEAMKLQKLEAEVTGETKFHRGKWFLTDIVDQTQLASPARLATKRRMMQSSSNKDDTITRLEQPLLQESSAKEELQIRAGLLQTQVEDANRRARELQTQLNYADRSFIRITKELQIQMEDANRRAETSNIEAVELLRELQDAEDRIQDLQRSSAKTTQKLRQCEDLLQEHSTHWVVKREEIELTGPELEAGGWTTVNVAKFRGTRVAVKRIHDEIISRHNLQLFQREMSMAARLRHPNLIQFIGATMEGEMMMVMELMATSLRSQLQSEQYFPPKVVKAISLDAARGLNYLHLIQPDPIVHRDINSANVLLEQLALNNWRAKLTDYGSVNLVRLLHIPNPGSPAYAAPEASNPRLQSPKMDMYSFGALVLEMLTGQLPAPDDRPSMLSKVKHEQLLRLIRRCLSENPEDRPSASNVISELNV